MTVAAGTVTSARIALSRGAVITGSVRDIDGGAAANIEVSAERNQSNTGAVSVRTDASGSYRLYGLEDGEYLVSAIPRVAAFSGDDVRITPVEEVDRLLAELVSYYSGSSTVRPKSEARRIGDRPNTTQERAAQRAYGKVFYPGTPDPVAATKLTLRSGQEVADIDIPLVLTQSAHITGVVQNGDGTRVHGAFVNATCRDLAV